MEIVKEVGKNVRKYREQRRWSQEYLAEVTGLHRTYISGIERGTRNPTITIVNKIAEALKIDVSNLFKLDKV